MRNSHRFIALRDRLLQLRADWAGARRPQEFWEEDLAHLPRAP